MNRRALAARLSLLVALAGLAPIAGVGVFSIQLLSRRLERSSQEALRAVASQAAARIKSYLDQQRVLLGTLAGALAGAPDRDARLQAVPLDAPSLSKVRVLGVNAADIPAYILPEDLARTRKGQGFSTSSWYLSADQTPAMDMCLPLPGNLGSAVCATLDLLELQRLVQRIQVGESGYALAFDKDGHLLASGSGQLRPEVFRGGIVAETPSAMAAAHAVDLAPVRYVGGTGAEVLAGWAALPEQNWTLVVEQPTSEALAGARTTQFALSAVAVAALLASIAVGVFTSLRMLAQLEVEERWRTAGRIATGISHDLGHRLAILQQTAALAETNDGHFLPQIRENLRNEVATLKKFVGDFADLSREVRPADLLPLQVNAFLESLRRSALPHAEKAGVSLLVNAGTSSLWVRADRYLLERATLNLVYNAIEASPRGGMVQLGCASHQNAKGQPQAVLEVRDQGMGIEPERLPRIFDAFRSTKRTGAHVGMGLPNVHRIITAHGGNVTVESELGKGSTFSVALPVTQAG